VNIGFSGVWKLVYNKILSIFLSVSLSSHHHLSSSHDHDHLSIFNVVNIIQIIHPSDVYNIMNGQEKGRRYDDDDCDDDSDSDDDNDDSDSDDSDSDDSNDDDDDDDN